MIRPLRPTDIGAFMSFRASLPVNEALGGPARSVQTTTVRHFVGQSMALEPGRETWVQIENGRIDGLVSARARFGTDVWDVDQLMVLPSDDADRVAARLLDHLCRAAIEEGIHRVFLRMHDDSSFLLVARQAGFLRYTGEVVFEVAPRVLAPTATLAGLRPRRPADHQAIFQLYCTAVPANVRQVEAMTLQEWRWLDNWGFRGSSWRAALTGRRRDFVIARGDGIEAWSQVDLENRAVHVLSAPRDNDLDLVAVISRSLTVVPGNKPAFLSAREYQREILDLAVANGLLQVGQHALLARPLAVRVPEGKLVPARA